MTFTDCALTVWNTVKIQNVMLQGESGSGKTSLISYLMDEHPEARFLYGEVLDLLTTNSPYLSANYTALDDKPTVFVLDEVTKYITPTNYVYFADNIRKYLTKLNNNHIQVIMVGNSEHELSTLLAKDLNLVTILLDTQENDQHQYLKKKYNKSIDVFGSPREVEKRMLIDTITKIEGHIEPEQRTIQFELWHHCGNKCAMCYLGSEGDFTPDTKKIEALNQAYEDLNNPEIIKNYNTIGLIGGEFFQGQMQNPEVRNLFFRLIRKIHDMYKDGSIIANWIDATLTIGDEKDLYEVLDIFKDIKSGFWLITSYDTAGRFHTKKMEDHWHEHMKRIHDTYPNVHLNICSILTGDFINKYLSGELSLRSFMEKYDNAWFLKQPYPPRQFSGQYSLDVRKTVNSTMLPNFFPKRQDFINFLIKVYQEDHWLWDKLYNIHYRANTLIRNSNDDKRRHVAEQRHKDSKVEGTGSPINPVCGHLTEYCAYSDSDACMLCDKQKIQETME